MSFTHLRLLRTEDYEEEGHDYCLEVYEVQETGEYQCFISREGDGLEIISMSSQTTFDSEQMGDDPIEWLLKSAKSEINQNNEGQYR